MRLYHGSASNPSLRKARQAAPSHTHGHCLTPQNNRWQDVPFIVDNGEWIANKNGEQWNPDAWLEFLDELSTYAYKPDFVVLPDGYNDAEKTIEKHRKWAHEVLDRGLDPAPVLQPGLPIEMQAELARRLGADFVFVGGETRWKRAYGQEIVEQAHKRDLKVHIGNPSGKEGLTWAYKIGADSADTTSVVRDEKWGWLEKLEECTLSRGVLKKGSKQATLTDGGQYTEMGDKAD